MEKQFLLKKIIREGSSELGIELTDDQIKLFQDYYEILLFWNKTINLTSIVDEEGVARKHFIDSLSYTKAFPPFFMNLKFLDIGSGAGFPGVPLKITFPFLDICLMEPSFKRTSFLHTLNFKLNLGLRIIENKAETWLKKNQIKFDIMMMRAIGNFAQFTEKIFDYLNDKGRIVISTGPGKIDFKNKQNRKIEIVSFVLPSTTIKRNLLIIHKH